MTNFWTTILAHGDTIIIAIVAVILGIKQLSSGTSVLRKEITADYKERNDQLDVKIKDLEEKFQQSQVDMAALKATLIEKDKRIQELRDDLQGRNPDIVALLKEISKSNIEIMSFMRIMHTALLESKNEMTYQTGILEKGENRNIAIDEASKKHLGEPVLVPVKQ